METSPVLCLSFFATMTALTHSFSLVVVIVSYSNDGWIKYKNDISKDILTLPSHKNQCSNSSFPMSKFAANETPFTLTKTLAMVRK